MDEDMHWAPSSQHVCVLMEMRLPRKHCLTALSTHYRSYFINYQGLHCTKAWVLCTLVLLARFGCSQTNMEGNLVGLPISMGNPLTNLPISQHCICSFHPFKIMRVGSGGEWCNPFLSRLSPTTRPDCPFVICNEPASPFIRFKSCEEDRTVAHHPGSLLPSLRLRH
ncbi:hypothetical protein VPH35_065494 [Triticum aestivum]